jgi:serine/threonine-protein kinase
VLYELLTGKPPFSARTPLALMAKHFTEAPRPFREHGVVVPDALDVVVMRLLAKEPDARPPRASVVETLLRVAPRHDTAAGFFPALKPTPQRTSPPAKRPDLGEPNESGRS